MPRTRWEFIKTMPAVTATMFGAAAATVTPHSRYVALAGKNLGETRRKTCRRILLYETKMRP